MGLKVWTVLLLMLTVAMIPLMSGSETSPPQTEFPNKLPQDGWIRCMADPSDMRISNAMVFNQAPIIDTYTDLILVDLPVPVYQTLAAAGCTCFPVAEPGVATFDKLVLDAEDLDPQDILSYVKDQGTGLEPYGVDGLQSFKLVANLPSTTPHYLVLFNGPITNDRTFSLPGQIVGLPVNNHGVIAQMTSEEAMDLQSRSDVVLVIEYLPVLKLRDDLDKVMSQHTAQLSIVLFKTDDQTGTLDQIEATGATIQEVRTHSSWNDEVLVEVPTTNVMDLARIQGVDHIAPQLQAFARNDNIRWVLQSYNATSKGTPIWDHGIHGEGVVIGCADSGIDRDHPMFAQGFNDTGTPGPSHRKIAKYNTSWDDWDWDGNADSKHGTHVCGILVGDDWANTSQYDTYDSLSYASKLAFFDVVGNTGTWYTPAMDIILDDAYQVGANSHSDSWGDNSEAYTIRAQRIDQYQWDHYEYLVFIAPGNGGTVLEPATAKNIISVANGYSSVSNQISGGSAVGPTLQGEINPHITAPGTNIRSALSDGTKDSYNDGTMALSGTSMSTPAATAACALVEQYFRDGYYPTGQEEPFNGFTPSGPLKKAMLLNSGRDMNEPYTARKSPGTFPGNTQGWGKIKLDDVLMFNDSAFQLYIDDTYQPDSSIPGLTTGETISYNFYVHGENDLDPGRLEITLVWNDYPGTGLKNDLHLKVTGPDGSTYWGNQYFDGESTLGGGPDDKNTVESFYLKNAPAGAYTVNVTAATVSGGEKQKYSLVVTGDLDDKILGRFSFSESMASPDGSLGVTFADASLVGMSTIDIKVKGLNDIKGETFTLTETSPGNFEGTIITEHALPVVADGKVQVMLQDRLTVTYYYDPLTTSQATVYVLDLPPRLVSQPTPISMTEDSSSTIVELDTYFHDESSLSFELINVSDGLNLQLYPNGDMAVWPVKDFSGQGFIHVRAWDIYEQGLDVALQVFVTPVNDPPILLLGNNLTTYEDMVIELNLSRLVQDKESSPNELTITCDALEVSVYGHMVYLEYTEEVGTVEVLFNISDPDSGLTSYPIDITVLPTNDAPRPLIYSPTPGYKAVNSRPLVFDASYTRDDEGPLFITWMLGYKTNLGYTWWEHMWEGNYYQKYLKPGEYSAYVIATDNETTVTSSIVDFTVLPDMDWDSLADSKDPDMDGDGVHNTEDVFPTDKKEWSDSDGDGVGNNSDPWPIDPTVSIDEDEDGYPDVLNDGFIPSDTDHHIDEMPNDPDEAYDNDKDRIGDNADTDDDNDLIKDWWEKKYAYDQYDHTDAVLDRDDDGLTTLEEYQYGTDPDNPDTDGDGLNDGDEIEEGYDPLDETSCQPARDTDLYIQFMTGVVIVMAGVFLVLLLVAGYYYVYLPRQQQTTEHPEEIEEDPPEDPIESDDSSDLSGPTGSDDPSILSGSIPQDRDPQGKPKPKKRKKKGGKR